MKLTCKQYICMNYSFCFTKFTLVQLHKQFEYMLPIKLADGEIVNIKQNKRRTSTCT